MKETGPGSLEDCPDFALNHTLGFVHVRSGRVVPDFVLEWCILEFRCIIRLGDPYLILDSEEMK